MRFFKRCLLAVLSVAVLSGCTPKAKSPLRVAFNAWPGYEFISLAYELGYFKDEGLEVTALPFETLSDGRRAFEKRQVDVLGGTLMEFYTARDVPQTRPVVFLVADYSNGGDMLLAHKDIPNVAALKGKKVAFEAGTVDVLTLAGALASAKLGFGDVIATPMPQPNAIKALLDGKVAATQTYPPFATEALANPNIHRVFDTSQTPNAAIDVLMTHSESLTERAEDYQRFVRAFFKARAYYEQHSEDAIRRMAAREKITPAEFTDAMTGIKLISLDDQAKFFAQGQLERNLAETHAALIAIQAIKGPACGAECASALALPSAKP